MVVRTGPILVLPENSGCDEEESNWRPHGIGNAKGGRLCRLLRSISAVLPVPSSHFPVTHARAQKKRLPGWKHMTCTVSPLLLREPATPHMKVVTSLSLPVPSSHPTHGAIVPCSAFPLRSWLLRWMHSRQPARCLKCSFD
jgi:hypothetical protein